MKIAGFSIEDWGALITLIAVTAGGILTMFRYIVLKPLNDSIKDLGRKISSLGEHARQDARENAQEIQSLDKRVVSHGERITKLEAWKETSEKYVKNN